MAKSTTPPNAGKPPIARGKGRNEDSEAPMSCCKNFTTWSIEQLTDYDRCPLKAYLKHTSKLNARVKNEKKCGCRMVEHIIKYVQGKIDRVPKGLESFGDELKFLRSQNVKSELKLAITNNFEICKSGDYSNMWCEAEIDSAYFDSEMLTIIDFQAETSHISSIPERMSLFALICLVNFPNVEKIKVELWNVEKGTISYLSKRIEELPAMKKYWTKRTRKMLADRSFKPTPSLTVKHCCPHSNHYGGQCEY